MTWRTALRLALLALASPGGTAVAQSAPAASLEIYAKPQQLVTLADGRKMNLLCMGSGSPTVILEAGWADSNLVWRLVQPMIAQQARVCAYDRAGLGFSERAFGPRDTAHIVDDLEALVRAAGLTPPFLLVGHSLGGLSARLFADRNLPDMAGLVLVDPSVEHQDRRFEAALPGPFAPLARPTAEADPGGPPLPASVQAAVAESRRSADFQVTSLAELIAIPGADSDQVFASRRSYGAMPLIVLTGSDNTGNPAYTPAQAAAFKQLWNEMHDEIAALSSRGVNRQIAGSTHLMVYDQPSAIAQAVDEVISQWRSGSRSVVGGAPHRLNAMARGEPAGTGD